MITREQFNALSHGSTELVGYEEMIKFLKKKGYKLTLAETKQILAEYFGVKLGDTILSKKGSRNPGGSEKVSLDGDDFYLFKIKNLRVKRGAVRLDIVSDTETANFGDCYSGNEHGSGIFYFFIDCEFHVLRRKLK